MQKNGLSVRNGLKDGANDFFGNLEKHYFTLGPPCYIDYICNL